jgi:hypothetical protein
MGEISHTVVDSSDTKMTSEANFDDCGATTSPVQRNVRGATTKIYSDVVLRWDIHLHLRTGAHVEPFTSMGLFPFVLAATMVECKYNNSTNKDSGRSGEGTIPPDLPLGSLHDKRLHAEDYILGRLSWPWGSTQSVKKGTLILVDPWTCGLRRDLLNVGNTVLTFWSFVPSLRSFSSPPNSPSWNSHPCRSGRHLRLRVRSDLEIALPISNIVKTRTSLLTGK